MQKSHQREKLRDAMQKYDILRFVAGYPLPPDLNSTANSVKNAINALGQNVALASIQLDTFRAHFISEGEAGILEVMEHALSHKRKANEMDS